ncbi:MAG: efflux RND transporter permease subunit [Leptospirales bacterium]|nr:efflux RND transporter permease subunit [Leptospirales bacterium]
MSAARWIVDQRMLFLTLTVALSLSGLLAWRNMPKEEDPRLKERNGYLIVIYPGGSPAEIERLIVLPVEEQFADISDIKNLSVTIRREAAIFTIELRDALTEESEINEAWRDVQTALEKARVDFPSGAQAPELNRSVLDLDSVVLSLSGSEDRLLLYRFARELQRRLLRNPLISNVRFFGHPERLLRVDVDDRQLAAQGLNYNQLARAISGSNRALPAGALHIRDLRVGVSTNSSFASPEELVRLPVPLANGEVRLLGNFAHVALGERKPSSTIAAYNDHSAILVGVVARNNIDLIAMGRALRQELAVFREEMKRQPEYRGLAVEEIAAQPDYVRRRLSELLGNLGLSMLIVAAVVIVGMGFRAGALAAAMVPGIALVALFLYASSGGVMHQIAVAAFVLSLGILIDSVIVVTEAVQEGLDRGLAPLESAAEAVQRFALPLAASTGTTVAAFLPMLGATGGTADFTRAIPLIAMLTLIVSYCISIVTTPPLAARTLRAGGARSWAWTGPVGLRLGSLSYSRPWRTLVVAFGVVLLAVVGFSAVKKRFFPGADRDQLVVAINLTEGAHIDAAMNIADRIDRELRRDTAVTATTRIAGRSLPQFYYNLIRSPQSPHVAQILVSLRRAEDAPRIAALAQTLGRRLAPEALVVARLLEQGPPSPAPVEIRLTGESRRDLADAVDLVLGVLRQTPAATAARHDMGPGSLSLRFQIGDANALQRGLSRDAIAAAVLGRTRGLPAGDFRGDDESIPIEIGSVEGENLSAIRLKESFIARTGDANLRLSDLATPVVELEPAVLSRRNRQPTVSVLAELRPGATAAEALSQFRARLQAQALPTGARISYGGEAERSAEANTAILRALPAGLSLFFVSLLFEFRSIKKLLIILATIPLAMVGVTPGLLLSRQPFGFTALLGMLALTGIVVNNAILLLDALDRFRRDDGMDLRKAMVAAIQRRMRPILLTTATTIAGLLPLAFTSATLWPPFAWSLMSGLALSTGLTLVVIPALYSLLFPDRSGDTTLPSTPVTSYLRSRLRGRLFAWITMAALAAPLALAAQPPVRLLGLEETLRLAAQAPAAVQAAAEAKAREYDAQSFRRSIYLPQVGVVAGTEMRDRRLTVRTPLLPLTGDSGGQRRVVPQAGIEITQPLYDPENMDYRVYAVEYQAKAAALRAERARQEAVASAATAYLDVLELDVHRSSLQRFVENLNRRRSEVRRLYELGMVSQSDLLRLKIAVDEANRALQTLEQKRPVALLALGRSVGLEMPANAAGLDAELPERASVPLEGEIVASRERRYDLQALALQIRARERELEALQLPFLPSIFARGQWVYQDSGQLTTNNWFSLYLGLRLPIFESATRSSRRSAVESELRGLRALQADAERAVRIQLELACASLSEQEREVAGRRRSVSNARQTVLIELERYRSGRSSLSTLLEAEELLRTQEEKLALAPLAWRRAWFEYALARGDLSVAPDNSPEPTTTAPHDSQTRNSKGQSNQLHRRI